MFSSTIAIRAWSIAHLPDCENSRFVNVTNCLLNKPNQQPSKQCNCSQKKSWPKEKQNHEIPGKFQNLLRVQLNRTSSFIHSFILKTYIAPLQETTTQRRKLALGHKQMWLSSRQSRTQHPETSAWTGHRLSYNRP